MRYRGYSKYTLYEVLSSIIPLNEEYQVKPEINSTGYPAYFNGYGELIHINEYALRDYIQKMQEQVILMYPNLEKEKNELFAYLTMFTLLHEVEHAYQYMIGQGHIDNPYQLVKDGYKYICDFSYEEKWPSIWVAILIERYKQQKDKATFVLERNANVEAYQLLNELSKIENRPEIERFMYNQYLWYSACGYLRMKNNGSFEESYRDIWRHKTYKNFDFSEDIPVQDRIRYGLPLDHESRKFLLKRFVDTKDNR